MTTSLHDLAQTYTRERKGTNEPSQLLRHADMIVHKITTGQIIAIDRQTEPELAIINVYALSDGLRNLLDRMKSQGHSPEIKFIEKAFKAIEAGEAAAMHQQTQAQG